jgi:GalNAc5-diNAcBac-PP-undecaprenol beta-1,3-glucosyltransferase
MVTVHPKPEVSIIMATYNRAHLIEESLTAIQNQTFENWECLIIDDGSTDATQEILKPYLLGNSRFKLYKRFKDYKKGLPGCRNQGIDLAKGKYLIFFDDDDIVHPQNLEICVREFKSGKYDYCRFGREAFTGEFFKHFRDVKSYEKNILDYKSFEDVIIGKIPFNSCQVMWKKQCFNKNKFNESLMYAEEWECYARILSNGFVGANILKVLYYGRKHPQSNTGEFWLGNKKRRESQIKAVKLVIDNLIKKQLFTKTLFRHFIQMGIFLKDFSIIKYTIQLSGSSFEIKLKYYSLYYFYPIIGRLYRAKRNFLKNA